MRRTSGGSAALIAAVALLVALPGTAGAQMGGGGHGGGGGGGGETSAANNLSYPAIWSEGAQLALPGTFGAPVFDGTPVRIDTDGDAVPDTDVWLQQDPLNAWQAASVDAAAEGIAPVELSSIDWGDNLEAKDWATGRRVRVETTLFKDVSDDAFAKVVPLTGFTMHHVYGQGTTEMWGTDGTTYALPSATATDAIVYSGCARLTIQRLKADRDDPALADLGWDPVAGAWTGPLVAEPILAAAVWEAGTDEHSTYGAELNVQGKVVYGYNWSTRGLYGGDYRLTFSLADAPVCPLARNTAFTPATTVVVSEEETEAAAAEEGGSGGEPVQGGGVAVVDSSRQLSYIDVRLDGPPAPADPPADDGTGGTTTPTTGASPAAPPGAPALGAAPPAVTPPASGVKGEQQRCAARLRFTFRLGTRLRIATRERMHLIRRVVATLDGKRIRTHRDEQGIAIPLRLRDAQRTRARLHVVLHLKRPYTVTRRSGKVRVMKVARTYSFPTCHVPATTG